MNIFGNDIEFFGWLNNDSPYTSQRTSNRVSIARDIEHHRFLRAMYTGCQPNMA
jgi:hypothetical protein